MSKQKVQEQGLGAPSNIDELKLLSTIVERYRGMANNTLPYKIRPYM